LIKPEVFQCIIGTNQGIMSNIKTVILNFTVKQEK